MICPVCKNKKLHSGYPVECAKCSSTGSVPDPSDLEDMPDETEEGFVDDEYEEI